MAWRLLGPAQMATSPASAEVRQRVAWDARPRSEPQERFYRELMSTQQLPSAPEIAQKMLVAVNREDSRVDDLARLIARDQSLTARLLRLANSSFFAIRGGVRSIPQAVTLLGFTRVRDIVLGLSVWSTLKGNDARGKQYRRTMWVHTATVAAAAKMLAERTGGDGATAFAAGLLHDVGKLVLGLRLGATYWALLDEAIERGEPAARLEEEAFGCHHATVGGWILQIWQLPQTLVDPVALHHDPISPDYGMDITASVAVANRLIDATDPTNGVARSEALDEVRAFAPGLLDSESWREMYASLAREQQAAASIFEP
jgi:putative nucleotidyltransferase with HDIG domain